ncbi:MAG: tetratricopeptide repeat protein, partial [Pyrinomonadaceae bacterium]
SALAGRNEEAITAFRQALQVKPDDHDVLFSLGNVYSNMRRWKEAIEEYKRAISVSKKDGEAFNNLGVAYVNLGLHAEAVKYFEQAIRIHPNWAEPHFNLGNANTKLGRPGAAKAAYERAIQLRPDFAKSVPQSAGGTQTNAAALNNATAPAARENSSEPPRTPPPSAANALTAQGTNGNSSSPAVNGNAPQTNGSAPRTSDSASSRNTSLTEPVAPRTATTNTPNAAPNTSPNTNAAPSTTSSPTTAVDPTSIYRVGIGDVLDIRLLNAPTNNSTLYTVQAGGVLEYPLVGDPLVVAGMTTDEIDARLTSELQRRAIQANPQVVVSIRDYASHTVLVSGLVNNPGGKIIQREAVPLYVIIADAQPRPEAAQVVLNSHTTNQNTIIDLADTAGLNVLVRPGDVINVTAQTPQFYYIGGDIDEPGQKQFHSGITMTQAILAAGGYLRAGKTTIEIARQGADGRLNVLKYNMSEVMSGKIPDPRLQAGDRVEVYR